MMSFAGTPLVVPTGETAARLAANIDPSWISDVLPRSWPGPQLANAGWRGAFPPVTPRIGVLSWPAGASRFASGHFLTDEPGLEAIRTATRSGGAPTPADLVLDDGRRSLTAPMHLLAVRPLEKVAPDIPGLYLLTLVDDRFRWWYKSFAPSGFTPGTTTFGSLYSQIGTALGVTISADAVPSDYLKPSSTLAQEYAPTPVVLDAVALACGQRIVRVLTGQVFALNASTSLTVLRANLAREAAEGGNGRIAGHPLFLTP